MLVGLDTGDDPACWRALGFGDPIRIGPVTVHCDGRGGGIRGWALAGDGPPTTVDGIPTRRIPPLGTAKGERPLDHVVVLTGSLDRTVSALVDAGGDERRRVVLHSPMSFVRLGGVVVEVVERAGCGDATLWGVVAVVDDLGELPAQLVGEPKDAVQPGRRIVTAKAVPGLETAVAFMTPRVRTRPDAA